MDEIFPLIIALLVWVALSFLLAFKAKGKKIGFEKALILSLILSPLVGMVFIMMSEKTYPKRVRDPNKDVEL